MNKIEEMENEARNEGYERLPSSEDVTLAIIKDNEIFDETNIQNIIESSSNKNKINLSLSQEQIFTIHTVHPSVHSNVNHERLSNQSIDLKKSSKTVTKNSSSMTTMVPLAHLNGNGGKVNDFSESPEFSMTENEKNNLLRKFSVSVVDSSKQGPTNLYDFSNTYNNARVLEQEFRCSICNDAYEDPRVLDCLHSFCLACLADMELVKYHKSKANELCELDLSCEYA